VIDRNLLMHGHEETSRQLTRRGVDPAVLVQVREIIEERRALVTIESTLRGDLNRQSKAIGALMRDGKKEEAEAAKGEVANIKASIATNEEKLGTLETRLREHLLVIPNIPHADAPNGKGDEDNVVVRTEDFKEGSYGEVPPHWEIADALGLLDGERGAKLSGAMFTLLRGDGARLLRALVAFGLDLNRDEYEEIVAPHFVRREVFTGTGHLPKFAQDAYHIPDDDLWAIPTGEVPLMGMYQGEILEENQFPIRMMTHTSCFRREAGAAGKDTRGMQRLHEFHKVELVKLCTQDQVEAEYQGMLGDIENMLKALELPYRVLDLCVGDMSASAERTFDFEVYSPGVDKWLEVSSVGRFSNYQTRRGNIRYRPTEGGKPVFPHAMNGSGLATPRIWAALLEHGWEPENQRVRLPKSLVPYMGKAYVEARKGSPSSA
jgi:seryl-tRNA synthetase